MNLDYESKFVQFIYNVFWLILLQKFQSEIDKLKQKEQNFMRGLQNKENEIRQLNEKLEQKNEELRKREETQAHQVSENGNSNEAHGHQLEQNKAQVWLL